MILTAESDETGKIVRLHISIWRRVGDVRRAVRRFVQKSKSPVWGTHPNLYTIFRTLSLSVCRPNANSMGDVRFYNQGSKEVEDSQGGRWSSPSDRLATRRRGKRGKSYRLIKRIGAICTNRTLTLIGVSSLGDGKASYGTESFSPGAFRWLWFSSENLRSQKFYSNVKILDLWFHIWEKLIGIEMLISNIDPEGARWDTLYMSLRLGSSERRIFSFRKV